MQNKAWNEYSSSSDSDIEDNGDDSWFDDEKGENSKTTNSTTNIGEKEQPSKVEDNPQQTSNNGSTT